MRDSLYPEGAEKFVYAPGLQRSGIDAELALRGDGQIVGRVSTPTLPLQTSWIGLAVYREVETGEAHWLKQANIDASGFYMVTDLAPGRYTLHFHVHDTDPHQLETHRLSWTDGTSTLRLLNSAAAIRSAIRP
jgi:hypothetical protein